MIEQIKQQAAGWWATRWWTARWWATGWWPEIKAIRGQGIAELALILALVVIAALLIIFILGPAIGNVFSTFVQEAPLAPPSLQGYTPPPPTPIP